MLTPAMADVDDARVENVEPLRPEEFSAAVAVLAEAFRWPDESVPLGAQRLRRYLAVEPGGWLGLRVRRTPDAEPVLAGVDCIGFHQGAPVLAVAYELPP